MRQGSLPLLALPLALLGCPSDPAKDDTAAITGDAPTISIAHADLELGELVPEAVALVPDWLQDDLVVALGRLGTDLQNELATLLLDLDDPYLLDEVGFAIAHTSPEVLNYGWFFPEILVVNAELIYAYDADLPYVALVDEGEPGIDADYHTTATYTVEEDGTLVDKTVDPDLYYWYVVHPRLEDELPGFLDAWTNDNPTDPDSGMFWREFLWDKAADECPDDGRACPLLQDYLTIADTVWKGKANTRDDNGAIGEITQYIWDAIDFGAGSERPVQPSRIYTVGAGNCGEHADLSCAAARVGLIPCRNVGARSNDHTWGEFWDERWVAFEPIGTKVDYFGYYGGPSADYYVYDGKDNDCDGEADLGESTDDLDEDGWTIADGDCNDNRAEVNPDMAEVSNGFDDDCNGEADEDLDAFAVDYDGDGWTITDGDCDDLDETVNPDMAETEDGRDENCDGVADEGTDNAGNTDDADKDGYSIADGDCDDADPAVNPGATEDDGGYDDDCDGVADEDEYGADYDGDGYSMRWGDCDDTDPSVYDRADDPGYTTGNRLYAMTSLRGDTFVDDTLTENYGVPAYLEFQVTDDQGLPVDGVSISIFGTWAVYGHGDAWTYASETVTDLDGYALATVGKHNPYGYAAYSSIGDLPGGGSLYQAVEWIEAYDTQTFSLELDVSRPALDLTVAAIDEATEPDVVLSASYAVESHRVAADGGFMTREYEFWYGSFITEAEGGRLDHFVLDAANLALLEAGEAFEVMVHSADNASADLSLELPLGEPLWLVLYNPAVSSHMVGTLDAALSPADGATWEGEPEAVSTRFRLPPQGWMSVALEP
jgi:hypothetical protein